MDKNTRPGKLQNSCRPGPGDPVPVKTAGIAGIDARPGKLQNSCRPGRGYPVPVKTAGIAGIDARPGKLQNSCHPGPGFMVPVETRLTFTNAFQSISTTENIKIDKKHENNEKIKKDSTGITKANEKNIKSKKEKINKDSIGITKTHEKNAKSKKCLKKSKKQNKSMINISRKVIQKKLNNQKMSKKANVKIQKNPKILCFPKVKYIIK